MNGSSSALLLVFAVVVVGVLHTLVPDHWAPIVVLARQRDWSLRQTARAAGASRSIAALSESGQ